MADFGQNGHDGERRTPHDGYSIEADCYGDASKRRQVEMKLRHIVSFLVAKSFVLETLDGITVTPDCRSAALAIQNLASPKPYSTEACTPPNTVELARTFAVRRGGAVRFHIALDRSVADMLVSGEEPLQLFALSTLAHEAAHVQHESQLYRQLPELQREQHDEGTFTREVLRCALDIWSEYAATRTAIMFRPQALLDHALVLQRAIERYKDVTQGAKASAVSSIKCGEMLVCAGYLLGSLAGLHLSLESAPRVKSLLRKYQELHPVFTFLEEYLDSLWSTFAEWRTIAVFHPICELINDLN